MGESRQVNAQSYLRELAGVSCAKLHDQRALQHIDRLSEFLEAKYSNAEMRIEEIAKVLHVSERTFRRKCQLLFGISPSELLIRFRLEVAKQLILDNMPVSYVAQEVGFSTHAHFTRQFKRYLNCTPKDFRACIGKG